MCSHCTVRWRIIIILPAFIMQFQQLLLVRVTDATNNRHQRDLWFHWRLQIPFVRAYCGSAKLALFQTFFGFNQSFFVTCVTATRQVCHQVEPFIQKKVAVEAWVTKTRRGLHAVLCGGELTQRHYHFLYVLRLPILQEDRKKIVGGAGPLEKNIRHDGATVTGCSFTTPSLQEMHFSDRLLQPRQRSVDEDRKGLCSSSAKHLNLDPSPCGSLNFCLQNHQQQLFQANRI